MRRLVLSGSVLSLFTAACGDGPAGPAASTWQGLFDIPGDYVKAYALTSDQALYTTGATGSVWVAVEDTNGGAALLRYAENDVKAVFSSPSQAVFEDVRAVNGAGVFAVGNKDAGAGPEPYAVFIDDETLEAEELTLPALPGRSISAVYWARYNTPLTVWLLLSDHDEEYYGVHAGVPVIREEDGAIRTFEDLGAVTAAVNDDGRFYGVEYAGEGVDPKLAPLGPGYQGRGELYITDDLGRSWQTELLPATINGRAVHNATALAADNRSLYLKVRFEDGAVAIVRRYGTPGSPSYELAFLSYPAPYFLDLAAYAVADSYTNPNTGILSAAVGVGDMTTVVFDDGQWTLEAVPYPINFTDVRPALTSGFVALGYDTTFGGWRVLYHP